MTEKRRIVLYADHLWESPYVFSVFVALKEKGLGFEERALDLSAGEQRAPEYRDRSLTARVPAVEHDGFYLTESTAIVEYLEEVFPAPEYAALLPAAPKERARVRQVMGWVRSDLAALRDERSTATIFFPRKVGPLGAAARAAADKLIQVADRLVAPGAENLLGSWTIADADLALMLQRLVANGDAVPEKLRAYAERQWERPSVRAFVEHAR